MKIIFYDGLCPMCNGWVRRLIRWDKKKKFRFAALESETAKNMLAPIFPNYLKEDTIVFLNEGAVYTQSTAALKILGLLEFPVNLCSIGILVPGGIRDGVYRWVASRRYKYGKRYESCPLPPAAWKDRFI